MNHGCTSDCNIFGNSGLVPSTEAPCSSSGVSARQDRNHFVGSYCRSVRSSQCECFGSGKCACFGIGNVSSLVGSCHRKVVFGLGSKVCDVDCSVFASCACCGVAILADGHLVGQYAVSVVGSVECQRRLCVKDGGSFSLYHDWFLRVGGGYCSHGVGDFVCVRATSFNIEPTFHLDDGACVKSRPRACCVSYLIITLKAAFVIDISSCISANAFCIWGNRECHVATLFGELIGVRHTILVNVFIAF